MSCDEIELRVSQLLAALSEEEAVVEEPESEESDRKIAEPKPETEQSRVERQISELLADNESMVDLTVTHLLTEISPDFEHSMRRLLLREIASWLFMLVAAASVALFINFFILVNAEVPSNSMENTVQAGDRLFGLRLSYLFSDPERGDVIIFRYPDDESRIFIKRIIGLPGETLEIRDAGVYINGSETPLTEEYLKEEWVTFADGYSYTIPEDCYFVMGDNRNESLDSRFWKNTFVERDAILAKAMVIYWPFQHVQWIE